MISAKRIYDQESIKQVMSHPKNKRAIYDDFAEDGEWPIVEGIYYIATYLFDELIGLFIGFHRSCAVLEAHSAMMPEYYKHTDSSYQAAIKWVEQNTDYIKLTGQTPSCNRLAIRCNERNGFKREGVNENSFIKNGKVYDQIYFGRCLHGS